MMADRIAGTLASLLMAGCLAAPLAAGQAKEERVPAPPDAPAPAHVPVPTPQQLAWQEMEFIAFAHFGMNTFTNKEWGDGKEDPRVFNPTALDARQWVRVCKDAGIKMIIVTCKHHDGFCLWPSKFTDHSVASSGWRDGKGDVVKEVSQACKEGGLKFGVYLSPWDRNQPTYGDSPRYNEYFVNQLTELLTNYGPVAEVWFDGACGEGPNGKRQVYDWEAFRATVRRLQPQAVMFSDAGPDVRWIGNERGTAGQSCWSMIDRSRVAIGKARQAYLNSGGPDGPDWVPGECDVSIRPGWFYHADQDGKVKSLAQLLDIYYASVGRNGVLLLNIPPDTRGLVHENDAARLREFRKVLDDTFRTNLARGRPATATSEAKDHGPDKAVDSSGATWWQPAAGAAGGAIEIDLGGPALFNVVMVQEMITEGQHVAEFNVEGWDGSHWRQVAHATTVGYKRLLRVPDTKTDRVRLTILKSRGTPTVREFGLFLAPPLPQPAAPAK